MTEPVRPKRDRRTSGLRGLHRVRWPRGGEPELQCRTCFDFWPITREFWLETRLSQCRTCRLERSRGPRAAYMRERRRRTREARLEQQAAWYRRSRSTLARVLASGPPAARRETNPRRPGGDADPEAGPASVVPTGPGRVMPVEREPIGGRPGDQA